MNYPKKYEVASENLSECNRLLKSIQRSIFHHIEDHAEIHVTEDGTVDATVNLGDVEEFVAEDGEVVTDLIALVQLMIYRKRAEIKDFLEDLEDDKRQSLQEEYEEMIHQKVHQPTGIH